MDLWVFGYGSLVWRPAFPFAERHPAELRGFHRRFWQGSPDHRGTPEAPGRVVTLLRAPNASVHGMAYRVRRADRKDVVEKLDHREQAGYETLNVPLELRDGRTVDGVVYVAGPSNPCFLGPAPVAEMAAQIQRSHGPSGPNVEYLLELQRALVSLGGADEHVDLLVNAVRDTPARSAR